MAANPPEVHPPNVGKGLTHKLGPLPVWGWIVVGGVVIGVGYLAYSSYQSAQGNTSTPSLSDLGSLLGGSGTPSGTLTTTPTTTTTTAPLTNTAWLQPLIASVSAATGYSSQEVSLYLNEYLAGFQPVGVPGGTNAFQTIVNSALGLGGAPPQAPPPVNLNANYFTSEQAYFNELQTFLPSGTSQSVIGELQNLFSGTTTTISQDAANALAAAQSVVGNGPNALVYSITGTTSGAPPTTIPQITQALTNAWDNAFLTLPKASQTFTAWVAAAPQTITQNVDAATLQTIYNYFNTAAGQAAVSSAGGATSWWNKFLASPSTTPITAPTVGTGPIR